MRKWRWWSVRKLVPTLLLFRACLNTRPLRTLTTLEALVKKTGKIELTIQLVMDISRRKCAVTEHFSLQKLGGWDEVPSMCHPAIPSISFTGSKLRL